MPIRCTAVFESGRLRPDGPLALEEGAKVDMVIFPRTTTSSPASPSALLAAIAALPMELGGADFTGRDHDKVLYPSGK